MLAAGIARAEVVYNIAVGGDGHYQLDFEQLPASPRPQLSSRALRLTHRGEPVAMQLVDGGDGTFGPGDYLRFTGRRLAGTGSWLDGYSAYNVYQLHTSATVISPALTVPEPKPEIPVLEHLEHENLRAAFPMAGQPAAAEHWYWQRITSVPGDDFHQFLSWRSPPERLRIALMGLSYDGNASAAALPQHHIHIRLAGRLIAEATWDGQGQSTVDITALGLSATEKEGALLEVHVVPRSTPDGEQAIVDAVLVNWIELEYPADAAVGSTILDVRGTRRLRVPAQVQSPLAVTKARLASALAGKDRQADYLMVGHESLIPALEPLAEYHRKRGLQVAVVDVQAIFDQFSHGIHSPVAIRDFVRHTRLNWRKPAPRLLLLAGDASWERATVGAGTRNLVPTMQTLAGGHFAASDNGLVTVEADDWLPDLAVGRLPAGSPAELERMVQKVLAHAAASASTPAAPLRTAWIAGTESTFQQISSEVAGIARARGGDSTFIFPSPSATSTDQSGVIQAFNDGYSLIHFLGHGGRLIWRTGPPDLSAASDLFGIEDMQGLHAGHRLPLVLSMTCSSGPFDHPSADSLAEALLRPGDRGAFGVVAAAWRVRPSHAFSARLVKSLLTPGTPVGSALMYAKRNERHRSLVESYNYLGDPAMPLIFGATP